MKKIFIFLILIFSIYSEKSFEFIIDNDAFLSDRWYTNGLEFKLNEYFFYNQENTENTYILGQKIYTPTTFYKDSKYIDEYDRPFAGLLYFGILKEKYKKNGKYRKSGWLLETTGKASLSDTVQKTYHKILSFRKPKGWDSQIENTYGIAYVREESPIYKSWNVNNNLDLNLRFINEIHMGNVILYDKIFGRVEFGNFNNFYKFTNKEKIDTLWNMKEYYLFLQTGLMLRGYDSTLQGNIFNNKSKFTVDIYPVILESKVGFFMKWKEFSLEYDLTANSTEIKSMKFEEFWQIYHTLKFEFFKF